MSTVLDVVRNHLCQHGFDGLVSCDRDCACEVDNLMPCGEMRYDCEPGHKAACDPSDCSADGNCDFHIVPGRGPTNSGGQGT